MKQRGWACVGFLMSEGEAVVFSDWSEHGMCELFSEPKEQFCGFCDVKSDRLIINKACDDCQQIIRKIKSWNE